MTCQIVVSFDVSLLFTNVPVGVEVSIISIRLREDKTLGDRTSLSSLEWIAEPAGNMPEVHLLQLYGRNSYE